MTSQINTNGIDVNYPVPGQNNSSQGFRDNFSQIRTNLNTTANEITDLQNKVVLKAPLNNTILNNDMANALISNCATKGFRSTTYNLGSSLSGIVLVDVNRADVQYGSVVGDVTFQFTGWSPVNTESNVSLRLSMANTAVANISLPSQCVSSNNNFGVTLVENYQDTNGTAVITAPADTQILDYQFSTLDCGNTITVMPNNRPFKTTQVQSRVVPPTGLPGDTLGTVAVDANYFYVCTDTFDSTVLSDLEATDTNATGNTITFVNTTDYANITLDSPIIFIGNVFGGLEGNKVYYVKTVSGTDITVSETRVAGVAGPELAVTTDNGNCAATCYVDGSDIWKRIQLDSW